MGYSARQEVQKISDAAAMGGSAMGAVGYKNIAVNGGNATAVIQRAEAINTANKIFRLNMNGNKINKYVTVNKVKYNQDFKCTFGEPEDILSKFKNKYKRIKKRSR